MTDASVPKLFCQPILGEDEENNCPFYKSQPFDDDVVIINYVKEYANLCSATALYLLALQSEELSECQRQEMVKKCESFIKLQEEIEETRFSIETLSFSPTKRKRKKNSKYDNEAFTSYNPPESIVENQTIDVKEIILAAQQAEQTYYSETGSDDSVNSEHS